MNTKPNIKTGLMNLGKVQDLEGNRTPKPHSSFPERDYEVFFLQTTRLWRSLTNEAAGQCGTRLGCGAFHLTPWNWTTATKAPRLHVIRVFAVRLAHIGHFRRLIGASDRVSHGFPKMYAPFVRWRHPSSQGGTYLPPAVDGGETRTRDYRPSAPKGVGCPPKRSCQPSNYTINSNFSFRLVASNILRNLILLKNNVRTKKTSPVYGSKEQWKQTSSSSNRWKSNGIELK